MTQTVRLHADDGGTAGMLPVVFLHSTAGTFEGTGHWLHMDKPEGFNRILDGFLAETVNG